ncbi:hypothetical protein M8J76_000249 [Diaphorina citri]|nr:hypothetical protein M8J75_000726 [Diaphorina citri]KAI5748568.1 hypothetical protein M8J76_000249 [Diaphorina citri]
MILEYWIIFFSSTLLAFLFLYHWKRRRLYELAAKIPGPPTTPILGNVFDGGSFVPRDLQKFLFKTFKEHNNLFRMWIGPKLYIFLKNSSEVEQVFINNPDAFAKSHDYDFLNSLAGQGIFCQDDEEIWHRNRKIVNKLFHYSVLKHYVHTFHEETISLVDKLKQIIVNKPSDIAIHSMLAVLTFNTIAKNTMGVHIESNLSNRTLKAVEKFFSLFWDVAVRPWLENELLFKAFGYKDLKISIENFARNVVREIIDMAKTKKLHEDSNNNGMPNRKITMIDLQKDGFSEEQLMQETITLIVSGQDTSASANSAALFLLSMDQKVQQEIFEELHSIFGDDKERCPTYEELQNMPVLDRCIKEVLRMYPPGYIIARRIRREIKIGDYDIPKDATIMNYIYAMHRDPNVYENPDQFNPDRFLPEKFGKYPKYNYQPFAAGNRKCIAYKYAMLQMKIVISTVLRHFKILPSPRYKTIDDLKYEMRVTLTFYNGIYVNLESRY